MGQVLDESGYHVVCLQEATMERLPQLQNEARWSSLEEEQQIVSARQPACVDLIMAGMERMKIAWAYFKVSFAA